MLKYITDYIADLFYFLTVILKIIIIPNNVPSGVYVIINSERVYC